MFVIAGAGFGVVNLFLTYIEWKIAVSMNLIVVGAAVYILKGRPRTVKRYLAGVALLILALTVTAVLFSTWRAQARHDLRLWRMAQVVCARDLPRGLSIEDCDGSISNTGNGNSCRYLATALVRGEASEVISHFKAQGYSSTGLDIWGDPMDDGRSYIVPYEEHEVRLAYQLSWAPDEGDLRCT